MEAFITMLRSVILFVAMALPGYIFVKSKFLKEEQSAPLSKILTHLGLPFLILSSMLNVELNLSFLKDVGALIVISLVALLLAVWGTAYLVRGEEERKKQGIMRFCMVLANNGFLGIPLAKAVFGNSVVVTYVSMLGIIFNLFMYTVGVYWVSGDKNTMNVKKAIFNPVLIAFVGGLLLNLVQVGRILPEAVEYANHFSGVVTPLSMTVLGMKLGGIQLKKLFTSPRMYYVSVWKLILLPIVALGLFFLGDLVWEVSDAIFFAGLIGFATPAASLSSAFADQYNGDTEGAAVYTLGSTVLSVATIPVLYWLLSWILSMI